MEIRIAQHIIAFVAENPGAGRRAIHLGVGAPAVVCWYYTARLERTGRLDSWHDDQRRYGLPDRHAPATPPISGYA